MTQDEPREGLGQPEHRLSGPTVDDSVAKAEAGSRVDGVHTPSGQAASGESRLEQMPEVLPANTENGGQPTEPDPAPTPEEIGSGGAQRIEGARVSDRRSAGPEGRQG